MNETMVGFPIRFPVARRMEFWIGAFLFAATLALFWPATGFGYINLDDYLYVVENPMVQGGLTGDGIRQAFSTVLEQWWLPLLWISFMADVAAFGAGPYGHHLVNVLLHATNAALLFWALFRMTGSRWRSFFVAALFAWHPTRMEAVAWITARKDVLSGLFFMLALWTYAYHIERPSARRMAGIFLLMLLGLMSKAILIVLPPILLLLDIWPLRRARWPWGEGAWREWKPLLLEKAPLIGLAAVFMGLNLFTHTTGRGEGSSISAMSRLGMIAPNYLDYLQNIVVPIRLSIMYPEIDTVWWPHALAACGVLLWMTLIILRQREQRPYWTVGWLWFLVALFPIIRGVRVGLAQYANRWSYLPLIGLGIALAWTAGEWSEKARVRKWIWMFCGLVLALCLARTYAHLPEWRNSLTVFRRAAYVNPSSHFAQNSLGLALVDAGFVEEGAACIRQAALLAPLNHGYVANLGSALLQLGRAEEALALQDDAIRMKGDEANYHNNRGRALRGLGRSDEARAAFETALKLVPTHPEANYNMGFQLYQMGLAAEALPYFKQAVHGRPGTAPMWYDLGMACAQLGRYAEADLYVRKALELDPKMPGARDSLMRLRLMAF